MARSLSGRDCTIKQYSNVQDVPSLIEVLNVQRLVTLEITLYFSSFVFKKASTLQNRGYLKVFYGLIVAGMPIIPVLGEFLSKARKNWGPFPCWTSL